MFLKNSKKFGISTVLPVKVGAFTEGNAVPKRKRYFYI